MTRPIAFFDFDGTLTRRDSLFPFLRKVAGNTAFLSNLALLSPVLTGYAARLVRNDVAKECVLRRFLAGRSLEALQAAGQDFAKHALPRLVWPPGLDRLRWHQEQGHRCVLVSASLDIYLLPWAKANGFEHVISSSLEIDSNGRATGRLLGANCHGPEKAKRIKEWMEDQPAAHLYGYGDSTSDLPMLWLTNEAWLRVRGTFRPVELSVQKRSRFARQE